MEGFGAPALVAPALLPYGLNTTATLARLRMASAGYTTGPDDDPANTTWRPRIFGEIEVSQSGLDAFGIGGRIALGLAEFEVANADRALDGPIARGTADGRAAWVRVADVTAPQAGDFGTPLGSAPVAFVGIVQRIEAADGQRARIAITDGTERLAVPLQNERYGGTGGLDGPASLAGKPKPVAIGEPWNVPPVPLGNIDLGDGSLPTYQVNWRAVGTIQPVRIRGVEQTDSEPDPPGVGEYRQWPDLGVFQLGSSPDGPVTCGVLGDIVGGHVSSTAGVLRRLVQSVGPRLVDGQIQTDSFDFAETDLPGAIGFFQGAEEITAAAAADRILAGPGAILCGARDAGLRLVDPLARGTMQFALPVGWILALEPVPLPAALRPLPREVAIDWAPNHAPLTDLAGSVAEADRAALSAAASGPARAASPGIETRVAQRRDMRLPGLYAAEADALARAELWREFFEGAPRIFRVTTDRYLGSIEVGDLGQIQYPAYGLEGGAGVVVLAWSEQLAGRRLVLTVATVLGLTVPEVTGPVPFFILDESELA